MALRVSIIPGTFSTQALVEGPSSKRARSMLFRVRWLLVDCVALGMVRLK